MYNVSSDYLQAIAKSERDFKIFVRVTYQNRAQATFTDGSIVGDIEISSQMISQSNAIDIGACTSKRISLDIIDDNSNLHRYAGARLEVNVYLKVRESSASESETAALTTENEVGKEYEKVKMGAFFVDASKLNRILTIRGNQIHIEGYDSMLSLMYALTDNHRAALKGKTAREATQLLVAYGSCGFVQNLSSLPNSNIPLDFDNPQIKTARDGIMWIAQIMGCFARIGRTNLLEYVPIESKWEYFNEEHTVGTIIAVRNIKGGERFNTTFSDDRIHIIGVSMPDQNGNLVTRSGGYLKDDANITIAMEKNPIIENSDKPLENILDDILSQVSTAYFYAFKSEINNDPALDAGDVVRLQGGVINGTNKNNDLIGFITHNTWRYRGHHEIVNAGQVPIVYQGDADVSLSVCSDVEVENATGENGEELFYLPPELQSAKAGQGVNKIDHAIIVSQYTSEYLKYNYTILPFKTYPKIYGGDPKNPVICGGFDNGYSNQVQLVSYKYNSSGVLYQSDWDYHIINGDGDTVIYTITLKYELAGVIPEAVNPPRLLEVSEPNDDFPYGYIKVAFRYKYTIDEVEKVVEIANLTKIIGFASQAEYDYARGVTSSTVDTVEVEQTATVVSAETTPGSIDITS